jgi:hypothetical protein
MNNLEEHLNAINSRNYNSRNAKKGDNTKGKNAEKEFAKILWKKFPNCKIVDSTKHEDMNDHWDMGVIGKDLNALFEVKSSTYMNSLWIEYINKLGNEGWILGKADYVAFRLDFFEFLICKRTTLLEMIERKCGNVFKIKPTRKKYPPEYTPYIRKNGSGYDMTIRVPIGDVMAFGRKITEEGII